jgi:glutamyl-tRNA reductase
MSLCAVGLNHRSAPLALRERVAFGLDELSGALRDLTARREVDEAVIVSTCNRTDVYCGLAGDDPEPVLGWLGRSRGFDAEAIRAHGYIHRGGHAVRHVMRVASGLDSLVLGEPQVLGQVKRAYRTAAETRRSAWRAASSAISRSSPASSWVPERPASCSPGICTRWASAS